MASPIVAKLARDPRFPVGTNVAVHRDTAWAGQQLSGAPSGTAIETATVASDGTVTFVALPRAASLVAYANVGGVHRYTRVYTHGSKIFNGAPEPDGAWSWFNDPHVICQRAGGWDWMHVGTVASNGDVKVESYDIRSGEVKASVLHTALEVDDHDPASLLAMPDGTLFATYSRHHFTGGPIYYRRTTDPADPTSWGPEQTVLTAAVTYPKPVLFPDGAGPGVNRLMIFYRASNFTSRLIYSDDEGETWSSAVPFLTNGVERPYVNLQYDPVRDEIDFLYTDGHPRDVNTSMYHMTMDAGTNIYKSDGTLIKNLAFQGTAAPSDGTLIYSYGWASQKTWGWNICRDPNDNSVIHAVFARFVSEDDHRYVYARWNGARWDINPSIIGASAGLSIYGTSGSLEPHYSGGMHLLKSDPTTIYLSRQTPSTQVWEIERWKPAAVSTYLRPDTGAAPLAHYPMGDPGTVADDVAGAHDGTHVNGPAIVGGAIANDSDGARSYVAASSQRTVLTTLGTLGANMLTSAYEFWFRWPGGSQTKSCLFGTVSDFTTGIMCCWLHTNSQEVQTPGTTMFQFRGNSAAQIRESITAPIYDGQWHHVVCVVTSATNAAIWVDGQPQTVTQDGNAQAIFTPINFQYPMVVGARNLRSVIDSFATAEIDELAFYPTRLSANTILDHHARGRGLSFAKMADVTAGSVGVKNVRPVCPSNPDVLRRRPPEVVWMRGSYASYISYDLDLANG